MRSLYMKVKKPIKISVCLVIVLSSILILALYGAGQDISTIRRDGTEYTFRARILEKTTVAVDKQGHKLKQHILVVQKTPTTEVREKRILVLVTEDTKIGYQVHGSRPRWQYVTFNDLKEETHIVIKGFKVIEREGDQELIVVLATQIEFSE